MQLWMLLLAAYRYKWVYRKGKALANAVALSRLPLQKEADVSDYVQFFSATDEMPLSAEAIRKATKKDPVLLKAHFFTLNGWPAKVADEYVAPYFTRRHELSLDRDCMTWGNRIIVPRALALKFLHEGHPRATRMKMLARSHVWWPRQTSDIENTVQSCAVCQFRQNTPSQVDFTPWACARKRWERVHLDFAFANSCWLLVLIDAYSKWAEVVCMKTTTAELCKSCKEYLPVSVYRKWSSQTMDHSSRLLSSQHSLPLRPYTTSLLRPIILLRMGRRNYLCKPSRKAY